MSHLPHLPSNEVISEVLPWWAFTVMREAHKFGIQKQAAAALKETWRLQDAVPWETDGVPALLPDDGGRAAPWLESPQPSEEALTAFRVWFSVVVESFGIWRNWCGLADSLNYDSLKGTEQDLFINEGYGIGGLDRDGNSRPEGSGPPPWENIVKTRKW